MLGFLKSVWLLGAPLPVLRGKVVGNLCAAIHSAAIHSADSRERQQSMQLYGGLQSSLSELVRKRHDLMSITDPCLAGETTLPPRAARLSGCPLNAFGRSMKVGFCHNNGYGPFRALVAVVEAMRKQRSYVDASDTEASALLEDLHEEWGRVHTELEALAKGGCTPSRLFVAEPNGKKDQRNA